jgi:AcrR family transcriptional regulator
MPGPRRQVRGEQLVARVLRAALAEMASVGPESLSIDDVAARARVNKTTIYRRWSTPRALATEALRVAAEGSSTPPDTGSLRGDLSALARNFRRIAASAEMRTILRMRFGAPARGCLGTLTSDLEAKKHAQFRQMLQRAIARGELPAGTDTRLLNDVVIGTLLYLVVLVPRRGDTARLERAMRLILDGATATRRRGT